MSKLSPIKASEEEVSQTINLKEIFGVDFSNRRDLKEALGQAFIDRIVEKAKSGKRFDGNNLKKPYSKQYEESLEFKAAGKSKNKINMTLTGDMLRSIDIIDLGANVLKIGIDDPDEAPKAYNHQIGDTVPARPFFGLNNKDVDQIKAQFKDEIKEAFKERGSARNEKILALIDRILDDGEG